MTEPLSAETLAQMRRDHANHDGECYTCMMNEVFCQDWPCTPALLLAELDWREANPPRWQGRQPVPHLALLVGV